MTTYIRYSGGDETAIVVDDGTDAEAVISSYAVQMIRRELVRAGPRALRSLSPYQRAGAGRWSLLTGHDNSCRLMLKPDDDDHAFLFGVRDTQALVRTAARLDAFPMVAGNSNSASPVVRYLRRLDVRPGFISVLDERRNLHGPDAAVSHDEQGCERPLDVLQPLGAELESSATRLK